MHTSLEGLIELIEYAYEFLKLIKYFEIMKDIKYH